MKAVIESVRVAGTPRGPAPVVLLDVEGQADVLPIFIGFEEATSIARGMDAADMGRPLTHDLLLDVVEELGGRVDRVHVARLNEGTFIADLHLNTPRQDVTVDARPSDALALAARTNCPVSVADEVFAEASDDPDRYAELDDIRDVIRAEMDAEEEGFL
ncbi:bifunctional nuclease family protein [Halomarina rubra]|uniref:Bifunctional nuclease family protein n=1 Tax=Halomarina rubra TaxID=2071873 RepID=A0ABD6AQ51_9EURY|nr:bifunctional nuclease family protein [Halomarina rubra]